MNILEKYNIAMERIEKVHIKDFPGQPGPVFLISTTYPGVWLEHVYDAVLYAGLFGKKGYEVAKNQTLLFINNQQENGKLPYNVRDISLFPAGTKGVGFGQIQECVSFGRLCWETYQMLGDRDYLEKAYQCLCRWDAWLCANRMSMGKGLIELYCLYDTGHDNSARFEGIPVRCPDETGATPADADALPILTPDMNAVFYGNRRAMMAMAKELGYADEAEAWRKKAADVRDAMFDLLYDENDAFFYDLDRNGNRRKFLSIAISNVFQEHVLTREEADRVYTRHMKNPEEFWTAYPFPSMAIHDPGSRKDRNGNSWGYYSQALTALRGARWMDHYGRGKDYDILLSRWVEGIARSDRDFCQELDPVTGEMSESSEWYSSALLLFVYACRRLGIV